MRRRWHLVVLAAAFAVLAATHLWWLAHDDGPLPSGDAYTTLLRVVELLDSDLSWSSPGDWGTALERLSRHGRPPFYQLMSLPMLALFGRSADVAATVNLLFLALLMVALYAWVARLAGPWAGVLAATLAAASPPIVHLTRSYRPQAAVPACVALSLCLLAALLATGEPRAARRLGLSLALGMLVHPTFVFLVAAPLALVPAALAERPARRLILAGLLPGAALAAVPALLWYLGPGRPLWHALREASGGTLRAFRGFDLVASSGFGDVTPGFWWYAQSAPRVLSTLIVAAALPAAAVTLAMAWRARRPEAAVAPVALIGGYATLASLSSYSWLYGAALVPSLAASIAVWIGGTRRGWARTALAAATVVAMTASLALVTWGRPSWRHPAWEALGARFPGTLGCIHRRALCPARPRQAAWPVAAIVRRVIEDPRCAASCRLMVVDTHGLNHRWIELELALARPPATIRVASQGSSVWGAAYPLGVLLGSDLLLVTTSGRVGGREPPESSYKRATVRFLAAPPPRFAAAHERVASFRLPTGAEMALIARRRPLTAAEAIEAIEALELAPRHKRDRERVLAPLLAPERVSGAGSPSAGSRPSHPVP